MTNSLAADGQTVITGQLRGKSDGTVAAPSYSWSNDLDSGFYRIAANNIGWAVNGAKVVDVGTAGVAITGTLAVSSTAAITGAFSVTDATDASSATTGSLKTAGGLGVAKKAYFGTAVYSGDGTESLPAYSFITDPDCGLYRIGANNLGIAVNGANIINIGTTGVTLSQAMTSAGNIISTQGAFVLDSVAYWSFNGGTPTLNFDTNDYLIYNRASNYFSWVIGGAEKLNLNGTTLATGAGVSFTANNMAKAFAMFSLSGTTVTFTAGNWFNIASVTRTGVGVYDVVFTSALPTANYNVSGYGQAVGGGFLFPVISSATTAGFTLTTGASTTGSATEVSGPFRFNVFGF